MFTKLVVQYRYNVVAKNTMMWFLNTDLNTSDFILFYLLLAATPTVLLAGHDNAISGSKIIICTIKTAERPPCPTYHRLNACWWLILSGVITLSIVSLGMMRLCVENSFSSLLSFLQHPMYYWVRYSFLDSNNNVYIIGSQEYQL